MVVLLPFIAIQSNNKQHTVTNNFDKPLTFAYTPTLSRFLHYNIRVCGTDSRTGRVAGQERHTETKKRPLQHSLLFLLEHCVKRLPAPSRVL
jgi:hypothetical protein